MRLRRSAPSERRHETGQSLTELAIAMTVILIVLAGVVDLGRLYYTYLALQSAAAEGAAYGSIAPTDAAGIVTRARGESPSGIVDWSNATITSAVVGQACTGGAIRVEAETTYTLITPFIGAIAGGQQLSLRASVVNTILSPVCP